MAGLQEQHQQCAQQHDECCQIQATGIAAVTLGQQTGDGGGRYLSMIGSNRWFHHPADRWPDSIDLDKLVHVNELWLDLARSLADA